MMRDKLNFWLWRCTIFFYIYVFATATIMYSTGHKSIKPSHVEKDYTVLTGVPSVSQESIDKAIANFEIQIPILTLHPKLDTSMESDHMGEAYPILLFNICVPSIGPRAFKSWSTLGAILAHEVEVHCNQNAWKTLIDKVLGNDATPKLEREAYMYMITDSKRFHLTEDEINNILYVVAYFYPAGDKNE